ncbi:MAG: hypothetical protein HKO59_17310 [Phycisphaerales bacterium]|nr:hypothetical protein [Phycisphaerales bacterium]
MMRAAGLLLQARAVALRAETMPIDEPRLAQFESAAQLARAASDVRPQWDEPLELLIDLYQPDGPVAHPQRYRQVIDQIANRIGPGPLATRVLAADAVRRGEPEMAIERVLRQYVSDPSDPSAVRLLVALWERFGPRGEAERWLESRLADTDDPHALEQLVRGLVSRDRIDEASARLDAWTAERGSDPAIRRLREMVAEIGGAPETAVELGLARLLRRPPGPRRALELAALLARNERPAAAVEHLQWIADTADDAKERHLLGAISVARRLGPPHEDPMTLTLAEAAVRRYPALPHAVYHAGLVSAATTGERTRFSALARRVAERDTSGDRGEGVLALRDTAQQLADLDRPDAAVELLRTRWDSRPPASDDARALLVSMILAAEAARPGRARSVIAWLEDLDGAGGIPPVPMFEDQPTLADAYMGTSQLFTLLGDDAGSDELLTAAIRLTPDDAMALNNRGYARIEAGRNDAETVASIERAFQLEPEETSILDTIAWLRYKQGRLADDDGPGALTLLERVLARPDGRDPEVLDHYGDVLWRTGRASAAVEVWREALEQLQLPERRNLTMRQYDAIQSQGWGLLVADPGSIYDREDGARIAHLQEKLAAVEAGTTPPVAPLFAELAGS